MRQLTYTKKTSKSSKKSVFTLLAGSVKQLPMLQKRGVLGLLSSLTLLSFQRKLQTEVALEVKPRNEKAFSCFFAGHKAHFPLFCKQQNYSQNGASYIVNASWFLNAAGAARVAGNRRVACTDQHTARRMLFNYVTSRGHSAPTFVTTSSHL